MHDRRLWLAVLVALSGLAALEADSAVRQAINTAAVGLDFAPLRAGAFALRDGNSIYRNPMFVYPPTAAVALLPVSLVRYSTSLHIWLYFEAVALCGACVLAVAPLRKPWWPAVAAISIALIFKADLTRDDLWLANLSVLLAPAAVCVLLLFERDKWTAGCAVLAASLLIKPLLAPLLLLPLLDRQWRPLLLTCVPALVLLAASMLAVPGGGHFGHVLLHDANGGRLVGNGAVYNISLSGLGSRLGVSGLFLVGRLIVLAGAVGVLIAWRRGRRIRGSTAGAGTFLLLAAFVAGSLSEGHYLLVAVPCMLLALSLSEDLASLLWAVPAFLLFFIPRTYVGDVANSANALQVRYAIASVLLLAAAAVLTLRFASRAGNSQVRFRA